MDKKKDIIERPGNNLFVMSEGHTLYENIFYGMKGSFSKLVWKQVYTYEIGRIIC